MTQPLPEWHQRDAAPTGQRQFSPETQKMLDDVEGAFTFRDDTPIPEVGSSPPVAQPGRPPMSGRAADASVMMITGGFLSLCLGAAVSGVLYFSGGANPVVVSLICAGPPLAFLSIRGVIKSLKQALPDEIHHHYEGTVYQDHHETTNNNRWWGKSSTRL